ncbi:MAG: acyl-CoA thioesterase [Bacteroidales bacterium]|nr:acyl-CoA thioesterase [Bacteroidales bacterium]
MKKRRKKDHQFPQLIHRVNIRVRFSEVDAMRIAWHGNYAKYFEDGREAFGEAFGIGYYDYYRENIATPIVNLNIDYKKHLNFGDEIIVETEYIYSPAAKVIFDYRIYSAKTNELMAEGSTTQVFIQPESGELLLFEPEFYTRWKIEHGFIKK